MESERHTSDTIIMRATSAVEVSLLCAACPLGAHVGVYST